MIVHSHWHQSYIRDKTDYSFIDIRHIWNCNCRHCTSIPNCCFMIGSKQMDSSIPGVYKLPPNFRMIQRHAEYIEDRKI